MAKDFEKLGKYDIVGKLGKGAMGEVYEGHDPVLNRRVAIKVIAETLEIEPDLVERFRREAKMAAQLNHPNIITIYDFVEEDGNLYIIMELLDGKDLKDLIRSNTPLTVEQILGFMEQISDGLGFAHENGMVHRDLKPANIHVTKKGQIKILDFGLVHDSSSEMTKTGHVMGTPNYMSPEQVQGLKVDPRSDIFSLGAVFYELLTRKKPFSADSIHATMFKVVQGEREPLSQYTHLPPLLVQMVDRALDANPDGRFDDGNVLRDHLRQIRPSVLAGGPTADSTMTSMDGVTGTLGPEPGSHPSAPPGSHPSAPSVSGSGGSYGSQRAQASASGTGGTMRRRDMTGPSMSGSVGVAQPSRPIGLYVGAAVLVVAIGGALFYFSGSRSQDSGPSVQELSQALVASQQEVMVRSLEANDFDRALTQADELLATDPQNTEALRVQSEARDALDRIDVAVAEARQALEAGSTEQAADALSRVLALDPDHPLGTELSSQLSEHFQGQAQQAQAEMDRARSQAQSASGQSEFRAAEQLRNAANADFNSGDYTGAAQKYLSARDQYTRARAAQQQTASAERQQAERQAAQAQAQQQETQQARQALQSAQAAWTRARNQPADNGVTQLPSYERALAEEAAAKRLEGSGDLEGAARGYQTATSYLETARREYREQSARQAEQQRAAATPPPAPAPAPAPPPPAAPQAPTREQEEAAIRQVLASYERAIETEDIGLFRQVKPNTTAEEAKRLEDSFNMMDDHQVELEVRNVTIQIDTATVTTQRSDTITVRGRTQNGNSRQSTFTLSKQGGSWIIVQIQ